VYKVAVLMSSYNGEDFILQQIDSILNQRNVKVQIYIRDDGSTDRTLKIIERFKDNVTLFRDENAGLKNSFGSLIWDKNIKADFYAFSDQDDVWDEDKLLTAVSVLSEYDGVGMYASNQRVVDANLNFIKPLYGSENNDLPFPEYKNFEDCFLHCNYFGNTIVLNEDAMMVIRSYRPPSMIVQHDTWVSIIVYMFGTIVFDSTMHSSYRQHRKNAVGGLVGPSSILKKVNTVINKQPVYARLANLLIKGYQKQIRINDLKWLHIVSKLPQKTAKIQLLFDKNVKDKSIYKTLVLKVLIVFSKF